MQTIRAELYDSVVTTAPNFQAEVRALLRDRLLDTAREIVCAEGWAAVTMSRVAKEVGISRQGLHKDIGTRQELGEALVSRETDEFLAGVAECLHRHGSDARAGLTAAVDYTLRTAADNPLVKAILTGAHDTNELLPLLAARPEPVLQRAIAALLPQAEAYYGDLGLSTERLTTLVEVVVRLTLSHLIQPNGPIDRAVHQIHQVIDLALP